MRGRQLVGGMGVRKSMVVAGPVMMLLWTWGSAEAETITSAGRIEAVTVYRGQAQVTRVVDAPKAAGLHEIVVTDLPAYILPGSLAAEAGSGLEVRSVRFRTRAVEADVREEVRKIDEQMRALGDDLALNESKRKQLDEQRAYLEKMEGFVAPTASTELTKGVLDPETLKTMAKFSFEERARIAEEMIRLGREERGLREKMDLLQRQRDETAGGSNKSVREAVMLVNATQGGASVRLKYLVEGATWSPSYNVRTEEDRAGVRVEYLASVEQRSGEDWNDVAMTLSTATPSLVARAPKLDPLMVALAPMGSDPVAAELGQVRDQAEWADAVRKVYAEQEQAERSRVAYITASGAPGGGGGGGGQYDIFDKAKLEEADSTLNTISLKMQTLDIAASGNIDNRSKDDSQRVKEPTPGGQEGLSIAYVLGQRTSLPSRSDRQLIQIAAIPMQAEFYRRAAPLLTSYVYEEALVTNTSTTVLLAGPASTYVAGQFVGQDEMPTVAAGEKVVLGFGIDSSVRTSRELVERKEEVQGGNRVVHLTYRLMVENFGEKAANVRLMDRLPVIQNGADIRLTLTKGEEGLCKEEEYLEGDRKRGMLRWDVQAPAGATGLKAYAQEYAFRLEFDKNLAVTGMPGTGG